MTKEELIHMYNKYSKSAIFDILIKTIDDFESRTCENCIFFKIGRWDKDIPSNYFCSVNRHCTGFDYKDFGCNKFERKDK